MQTILSSNVPHYHYLAQALEASGYLKRYITSTALYEGDSQLHYLPSFWQQKLEGRRLQGIPRQKVRQLWLPDIMSRGLRGARLISKDRSNWLYNQLFDWGAQHYLETSDFFHFVNSVGLKSAQKAKATGATLICDVRQAHPDYHDRILQEEGDRLGIPYQAPGALYKERMKEEYCLADYLIVPSEYSKRSFLAEGYAADRVLVLPYGADLSHFYAVPRSDNMFRVLFAGKIIPRKGIHYLLQAMSELSLPNSEVLLVGHIDERYAPLLQQFKGVFRHVSAVPKVELLHYYSNASVFVLPSLTDSFGLVALEAMACGTPVILSDHTGSSEIITEGQDGCVVPARNVEALKEKILFFFQNPSASAEMGIAAMHKAKEMTWEAYGQRAISIYDNLSRERQAMSVS